MSFYSKSLIFSLAMLPLVSCGKAPLKPPKTLTDAESVMSAQRIAFDIRMGEAGNACWFTRNQASKHTIKNAIVFQKDFEDLGINAGDSLFTLRSSEVGGKKRRAPIVKFILAPSHAANQLVTIFPEGVSDYDQFRVTVLVRKNYFWFQQQIELLHRRCSQQLEARIPRREKTYRRFYHELKASFLRTITPYIR